MSSSQHNAAQQQNMNISFASCSRCGKVGHTAAKCRDNIPSIDEMNQRIEERINRAISLAPKEWIKDEYGLFLPPSIKRIKVDYSWSDGPFCLNCGQYGHDIVDCGDPTSNQLTKLFSSSTLNRTDSKSVFEKKQLISIIDAHCEKQNSQK